MVGDLLMMHLALKLNFKTKIMKHTILLLTLLFAALSCNAQIIIPIEEVVNYRDSQTDIPDNAYVKDVNHLLDKYLGTWIGTGYNKTFEFRITKHTRTSLSSDFIKDRLLIRYTITDANGNEIENTLSEPDNSYLTITGKILDRDGTYYLIYLGRENRCGQVGTMYLDINDTNTQLDFGMLPRPDMINTIDCPNGEAKQIFPFGDIPVYLDKQ